MALLTGHAQSFPTDTSIVDTSQLFPLGQQARDKFGGVWEYCGAGVASCLAGSWVVLGGAPLARTLTLLTTGLSGRLGVAGAALVANTYGWVQVYGETASALGSSNGTITSGGGQLQACSTVPGQVVAQGTSTGSAAGDYIFGAFTFSGQPSSADDIIASVFLNFPFLAAAAAVASS